MIHGWYVFLLVLERLYSCKWGSVERAFIFAGTSMTFREQKTRNNTLVRSLCDLLGWWKRDPNSKVVGDLQLGHGLNHLVGAKSLRVSRTLHNLSAKLFSEKGRGDLKKTALRLKVIEKPLVFGVFFLLLFFPFVCPVYMWLCRGLLGLNICRFSFVVEICIFEGFLWLHFLDVFHCGKGSGPDKNATPKNCQPCFHQVTKHFRYLKWRNPKTYIGCIFGYGLCKGVSPPPK